MEQGKVYCCFNKTSYKIDDISQLPIEREAIGLRFLFVARKSKVDVFSIDVRNPQKKELELSFKNQFDGRFTLDNYPHHSFQFSLSKVNYFQKVINIHVDNHETAKTSFFVEGILGIEEFDKLSSGQDFLFFCFDSISSGENPNLIRQLSDNTNLILQCKQQTIIEIPTNMNNDMSNNLAYHVFFGNERLSDLPECSFNTFYHTVIFHEISELDDFVQQNVGGDILDFRITNAELSDYDTNLNHPLRAIISTFCNNISKINPKLEKEEQEEEDKENPVSCAAKTWKNEEVVSWLRGNPKLEKFKFSEIFQRESIDGDSLFLLKDQDLKDLGIPLGPRLIFFDERNKIR